MIDYSKLGSVRVLLSLQIFPVPKWFILNFNSSSLLIDRSIISNSALFEFHYCYRSNSFFSSSELCLALEIWNNARSIIIYCLWSIVRHLVVWDSLNNFHVFFCGLTKYDCNWLVLIDGSIILRSNFILFQIEIKNYSALSEI